MPCIIMNAGDFGIGGAESPDQLETNPQLKDRLASIRLKAGAMMNLGGVASISVPKMTLVSKAQHGGVISTRSFIPHRIHASIGILAAIGVATACQTKGSSPAPLALLTGDGQSAVRPAMSLRGRKVPSRPV